MTNVIGQKIVKLLASSKRRFTPGAIRQHLKCSKSSVDVNLTLLLESKTIKADAWGNMGGYAYRHPDTENTAPVYEIKMKPQLVLTESR